MTDLATYFLDRLAQRFREEAVKLRQSPGDRVDKANAERTARDLEHLAAIAEGAEP